MENNQTARKLRSKQNSLGPLHGVNTVGRQALRRRGGRFAFGLMLVAVFFAAVWLRVSLISETQSGIESDEAIVGLMALHITQGYPWPVFYYGQHYLGSFEAILTAGVFELIGSSNTALKIVPLLASLFLIAITYSFARRLCSRLGAFVAALWMALGPSALILWSTKARGGFIELVLVGSLSLIATADLLKFKRVQPERLFGVRLFSIGLLLGAGWWINNQIIFYVAAIGLCVALAYLRRGALAAALTGACLAGLGFLLGGFPFWHYNLLQSPHLRSFSVLTQRATPAEFLSYLQGYFDTALPIILGGRRFWSTEDVFPGSALLCGVLYGVCFLLLLRRALARSLPSKDAERSLSQLLLTFLVVVPLIFSASGYGWLSQAPRYLLPLYSVLPLMVGVAADSLWRTFSGRSRGLAACSVALVVGGAVALSLTSNFLGGRARAGQPFIYLGERVADDQRALYAWLRSEGYHHIFTNYWIGYRTAFETEEDITFSVFTGPQSKRIPRYELIGRDEDVTPRVLVMVPGEAKVVKDGLAMLGYRFRSTRVGPYVVFDYLEPISSNAEVFDLTSAIIRTSSRQDWAQRLVDSDLGTRWGSGQPQNPSMLIEIEFNQPAEVDALEVDAGLWPQDAPREIGVSVHQLGAGTDCSLFDSRVNEFLSSTPRRAWQLYFEPMQVDRLAIEQNGEAQIFDWSVAELRLSRATALQPE